MSFLKDISACCFVYNKIIEENNVSKVIVGMSGGVDSAVTAYLLKAKGYEVIGVMLKTWINDDGTDSRCCEIDDASQIADVLGIPFYAVNCMMDFKKQVIDKFMDDYINARTPNPCVGCNRNIKWKKLIEAADMYGAEYVATGHYAHIVKLDNGRLSVSMANSASKDQTYMLYQLSQDDLKRTIMPLGDLTKDEVRKIAEIASLPVADKPDSQEICFIPDGDYAGYIEEHFEGTIPEKGNFINPEGDILGTHEGIIHYTIGQRKGLKIAFGKRVFVKEIRNETNEVVLSDNESLYTDTIKVENLNFLSVSDIESGDEIEAKVRIRYHHNPEKAIIKRINEKEVLVKFEKPVRAATPGQAAVFYDTEKDYVIGGGEIV